QEGRWTDLNPSGKLPAKGLTPASILEYTRKTLVAIAIIVSIQGKKLKASVDSYIRSFPIKPSVGGTPELSSIARKPAIATGIKTFLRPLSSKIFLVLVSWSIIPVTKNNVALYKACTIIKTEKAVIASFVPKQIKNTRIPSAKMVEKARISFKSFLNIEI